MFNKFNNKWVRRVAIVSVLLVVAVVVQQVRQTMRAGSNSAVERWVAGQLKQVAASYLMPTVRFDAFDYQAPRTVHLTGVTLTDPPTGEAFVAADRLTLVLAEVPREGKPVVIEHIRLERPTVLIANDPPTGDLIGFGRMLKDTDDPADQADDVDEPVRLNDVFRVRRIEIANGTVAYRDSANGPPMRLDNINTTLTLGDPENGWYAVSMAAGRAPVTSLSLEGRLNIDESALELTPASLVMNLSPDSIDSLPTGARTLIDTYGLRGKLQAQLTGRLGLEDPGASELDLRAKLDDGYADFGDYVLPIKSLEMVASIHESLLRLEQFSAETLGGRIAATGVVPVNAPNQAKLEIAIDGVRLERAFDPQGLNADAPPMFAGEIVAQIAIDGIEAGDETKLGNGRLVIEQGRLVNIPLLNRLDKATGRVDADGRASVDPQSLKDAADVAFDITPVKLDFTSIVITSPTIGVRGKGSLDFAGDLNLRLRGGPLEKFRALGALSPIHYHVTGPAGDPKVEPKVGSIDGGLKKDEQMKQEQEGQQEQAEQQPVPAEAQAETPPQP